MFLGRGVNEGMDSWRVSWLDPDTDALQTGMLGTLYYCVRKLFLREVLQVEV